MHRYYLLSLTCCVLSLFTSSYAQSISGLITDENNEPVPFANVFVKELESGTSSDGKGNYFLTLNPGIYHVVVSCVGYTSLSQEIVVGDKVTVINFVLRTSAMELNEVVVKVKRKDPAYEIIQHLIDNREKFLKQTKSSRVQVYVRANETLDINKKRRNEPAAQLDEEGRAPKDVFEEEKKKEEERLEKINLVEMNVVLNYEYPDRYKEERIAFKTYGSRDGLFIPLFNDADFNFYHGLVDLRGISEVPVISPANRASILSYRYKLEEILKEGSDIVYKIKVTPRKTGDATCRGYIYINEGTWNINRLELSLPPTALKFYDEFTIQQTYHQVDSIWMPLKQEFTYQTKAGAKLFRGNTVMLYSNFEPGYTFPPKFFGNEIAVTTGEAYKRDSTYWKENRPIPLTEDQRKVVLYRDSIEAVRNSQKFIDSVEARYNKVTLGEVLYHGVGLRKHATKRDVMLPSLIQLIGFEVIGGFRLGPTARYFRRYDNGRMFLLFTGFSLGLKNMDWQASTSFWTRYQPFKLGDAAIRFGRDFYSINSFDAYLNQLKISNYILHEHVDIFHRREIFNGFYISTDIGFANRKSVEGYDASSIINRIIDEEEALQFEDYQAFITGLRFSYTPEQKYMTEPNQKVILGSKFPTVSVSHKKGWSGVAGSDIDFDFIDFSLEQNVLLGPLGTSKYKVMTGRFFNTRDLRFIDVKRFRQSDPYLYSDPLNSFQLLDTALFTTNWFIEGHYIHHFNGAMINNIPLIKKLKLRTVAGAGFMWIKDNGFRHEEIFGGIERVFKLGARRRLRVGVYGVLSESNFLGPSTDYKISFDIIDTWKRDWSY